MTKVLFQVRCVDERTPLYYGQICDVVDQYQNIDPIYGIRTFYKLKDIYGDFLATRFVRNERIKRS